MSQYKNEICFQPSINENSASLSLGLVGPVFYCPLVAVTIARREQSLKSAKSTPKPTGYHCEEGRGHHPVVHQALCQASYMCSLLSLTLHSNLRYTDEETEAWINWTKDTQLVSRGVGFQNQNKVTSGIYLTDSQFNWFHMNHSFIKRGPASVCSILSPQDLAYSRHLVKSGGMERIIKYVDVSSKAATQRMLIQFPALLPLPPNTKPTLNILNKAGHQELK